MIGVCRPYAGITINNEVEYLLDNNGDIMKFKDVETAKEWLTEHGVDDDYMQILKFFNVSNGELIEEE